MEDRGWVEKGDVKGAEGEVEEGEDGEEGLTYAARRVKGGNIIGVGGHRLVCVNYRRGLSFRRLFLEM